MAEETAWNYIKEHKGFDVVVINPSFILGPPLNKREDATSIKKVKKFFEGGSDGTCFGVVDVRDAAEAHVRAVENPNASGRYSHAKAEKELGIKFTPLETTLVDMANALLDLGIVPRKN